MVTARLKFLYEKETVIFSPCRNLRNNARMQHRRGKRKRRKSGAFERRGTDSRGQLNWLCLKGKEKLNHVSDTPSRVSSPSSARKRLRILGSGWSRKRKGEKRRQDFAPHFRFVYFCTSNRSPIELGRVARFSPRHVYVTRWLPKQAPWPRMPVDLCLSCISINLHKPNRFPQVRAPSRGCTRCRRIDRSERTSRRRRVIKWSFLPLTKSYMGGGPSWR